ncbi:MAG TPA: transposase [Kofleriaceae bacterium]|jgi:hypothetical protein|nr:transposase [Kofleriaceae bacterium]
MPLRWSPPVELSKKEEFILRGCKKAKLFLFLRQHRHELFDDAFQTELAAMYPARARGKEPIAPALLAMVTLLQAALGFSDEDAVEYAMFELRWQMLLDCLGDEQAPFAQGTLFAFRQRLIAHDMDRRLLERTVELAHKTQGFSAKALRAAFDASPLFGAGRVEDTFNLIGHAARDLIRSVAKRLDIGVDEAARRAGIPVLNGSSIKATLDIDWDDPSAKKGALDRLLSQVRALEKFVESELAADAAQPPISDQLATLRQFITQDTEPDPDGGPTRIKQGVAKERRISVRDGEMRHGRKSKASRVDGYKRHVARDLTSTVILAVAITPANRPEAEATDELLAEIARQQRQLSELQIDRGYLAAPAVASLHADGVPVRCKPFPLRNGGRFTKADFAIDLKAALVTCPEGVIAPIQLGTVTRFPADSCQSCTARERCTISSKGGRSLSIHEHEPLLLELRTRRDTPDGRAALRARVDVEHSLAEIGRSQGGKARYLGARKNLFDLRRHAAVANLFAAARAA